MDSQENNVSSETYEVHALRYWTRSAMRSHEFYRFGLYGAPDADLGMDYSFWLARNSERTVLVDCGFNRERAAAKQRFMDNDPLELLSRMDVRPEEVDHVVISHMHYDHIGNTDLFPNATFSIAREEYDYWRGPYGDRELMRVLVDPVEVEIIESLERQERLQIVDGSAEVVPGIAVTRVGGHTPGQLIISIDGSRKTVVLASDAAHFYEEIEFDRPFDLYHDLGEMYAAYDLLRELTAAPDTVVVAGHDPRVRGMFEMPIPDCVDLNAPTY